ncbi:MAG TPA: restriction endonuclease subunit S [Syntrophomonadaceae bacterium]|nr:restriction endonuclease subunit S [Syntrophomonadaceae bacterium]
MGVKGWKKVRIEDIAESVAMGPFGSNIKSDNFVSRGVPVIRGVNLSEGRFKEDGFVFVTDQKADELKKSNAFPNDIILTHRGTLGQVGIIPCTGKYERYVVSQSQMRLTCDKIVANPLFIYYYFKSEYGRNALLANTVTTGVPAIARPLSSLKVIELFLPGLNEQEQIARILSALDDKIELNNRINKTLEEIAQAIFKHWFVDFEFPDENGQPYKSSGGEMEDSELGPIPKGWTVDTLGELIDICSGKRPKSRQATKSSTHPYPLIGARTIMGYVDEYLYNKPIIVTGRVGTHGVVRRYSGETWPSDNTLVVESKYFHSIYQWMSGLDYSSLNRGSTQPLITQTDIKNQCIIRPTESFLVKYEHLATISIMQ